MDIIIPVLNEERIFAENEGYYSALAAKARILFVDGGSRDNTVEAAGKYGSVVSSKPGRAYQKNQGAATSTADRLLFLHVDSFISNEALSEVSRAFDRGVCAGCLTMKIDDEGGMFRIYENAVNLRAKHLGIMDGDLGMFIKREIFEEMGRFDELPIMEDILFGKKMRKILKMEQLPAMIHVSSRKWREEGFVRTFIRYVLAYVQLWSGIPIFKEKKTDEKNTENSAGHFCQGARGR